MSGLKGVNFKRLYLATSAINPNDVKSPRPTRKLHRLQVAVFLPDPSDQSSFVCKRLITILDTVLIAVATDTARTTHDKARM